MTADMWIGFAIGAAVGFFIASVFASTKFWELYQAKTEAEEELRVLGITVAHLEQQVHPAQWSDDPQRNIKVKARLYDEYENLVVPGEEIIRIQEEGDIPEMSDLASRDWRDKMGDT